MDIPIHGHATDHPVENPLYDEATNEADYVGDAGAYDAADTGGYMDVEPNDGGGDADEDDF